VVGGGGRRRRWQGGGRGGSPTRLLWWLPGYPHIITMHATRIYKEMLVLNIHEVTWSWSYPAILELELELSWCYPGYMDLKWL